MVTIDGTSHGSYENCAFSCLFSTAEDAVDFVKKDLEESVANTVFAGADYSAFEIECAVEKYCEWFVDGESAQFMYGDSVKDYKIERMWVPEIKERGNEND
jgi:hypothetical protein